MGFQGFRLWGLWRLSGKKGGGGGSEFGGAREFRGSETGLRVKSVEIDTSRAALSWSIRSNHIITRAPFLGWLLYKGTLNPEKGKRVPRGVSPDAAGRPFRLGHFHPGRGQRRPDASLPNRALGGIGLRFRV